MACDVVAFFGWLQLRAWLADAPHERRLASWPHDRPRFVLLLAQVLTPGPVDSILHRDMPAL